MTEATAITKQEPARTPVEWSETGVKLHSMEDAWRFAQAVVKSGLVPEGLRTPEAVLVALQAGGELGLTPWQAIQSVVVIKGTPTIRVETARALVEAQGLLAEGTKLYHRFDGDGDRMKCVVWSFPRGSSKPIESEFSMGDAKTAGLAGKDNWKNWPKRMLLARATGFHIRDYYPTAIRRVPFAEEVHEIEERRGRTERDVTPKAERKVSGALAAKLAESAPPADEPEPCTHPEGFAETEDAPGERVCIHCGEREPVQAELLPEDE